jgi:putative sterol carrier protein
MKLGSPEYLVEVQKQTNVDEEYLRLAKNEYDSYTMVLEAEPAKGVKEPVIIGYKEEAGKIVDIWAGQRPTTYVLSGPYGVWVDILLGKIGPTKAFTMRKLKVKGNFIKFLASSDSAIRWTQILQTIPTEFEGDYAKFNMPGK